MEEGQRRAAHTLSPRSQPPPRLRNQQAHRATVRRSRPLSRRFPLSAPLSPRKTRLARRPLGGEERPAPPALLPPHSRGPESSRLAAPRLEGFCRGYQPHHGGRKCLIGRRKFPSASSPSSCRRRAKRKSLKSFPSISKTATKNSSPPAQPKSKPVSPLSRNYSR